MRTITVKVGQQTDSRNIIFDNKHYFIKRSDFQLLEELFLANKHKNKLIFLCQNNFKTYEVVRGKCVFSFGNPLRGTSFIFTEKNSSEKSYDGSFFLVI